MFGALGEEGLVDVLDGEVGRTEGVAQGFSPLVEAGLYHLYEELLVTFQGCYVVAREPDDGRFDLGRRVEDMLVDGEEVFDVVEG